MPDVHFFTGRPRGMPLVEPTMRAHPWTWTVRRVAAVSTLWAVALLAAWPARAEDGSALWLRYRPLPAEEAAAYRAHTTQLVLDVSTPMRGAARAELLRAFSGLLGSAPAVTATITADGAILAGTPGSSPQIAGLHLNLRALGNEGYLIRSVLYGAFRLLRLMQTGGSLRQLDLSDAPREKLRVLDHWDNLDGSVERGYAGESIWNWSKLPDQVDPRYTDYARANASIGINGVVLNNVNADARILTQDYLLKVAGIAGALRPYGMRVYLSARFSAPI